MGEASTSTSTSGKEFISADMECGREGTIIGESSSSISAVWKAFNPEEDCSEEMTGSDNDAIAGGFRKAFESDEDRLRAMTTIEEASASVSGLNTHPHRADSECIRAMTNIGESMEQWSPKRRDRVLIKIKRIVADEEEARFKDHYGHSP
ncbi:AGAP005077-PA-like protein [Anopheles sinensis]|uniref:AGAP005077-PA-like protein n=1 Tax=Anopheles sinensis TaxID=74873 RepID=A0A084VBB3_ANOSI|nr:AGAP005077-PA-like protein [Anopheles sinensis]